MTTPLADADQPRYLDFVTSVAGWEGVWGLYHNGWILHTTGEGQKFCPLFATREAARSWGASIRTDHIPSAITLVELIEHLMAQWRLHDIEPGICPTPSQGPVLPGHDRLHADLLSALKTTMQERFAPKR